MDGARPGSSLLVQIELPDDQLASSPGSLLYDDGAHDDEGLEFAFWIDLMMNTYLTRKKYHFLKRTMRNEPDHKEGRCFDGDGNE
jgi:hypothetical protein